MLEDGEEREGGDSARRHGWRRRRRGWPRHWAHALRPRGTPRWWVASPLSPCEAASPRRSALRPQSPLKMNLPHASRFREGRTLNTIDWAGLLCWPIVWASTSLGWTTMSGLTGLCRQPWPKVHGRNSASVHRSWTLLCWVGLSWAAMVTWLDLICGLGGLQFRVCLEANYFKIIALEYYSFYDITTKVFT